MTQLGAVEVIASVPAGTLMRENENLILALADASPAGWQEIRSALAELDISGEAHMTQLAWWADGVELWLIEP